MVSTRSYYKEYIEASDIDETKTAEIVEEPVFVQGQFGRQLEAHVRYCGEDRKLNINKGNAARLAEVWGDDTKHWNGRHLRLHLPRTDEEKDSKSKIILEGWPSSDAPKRLVTTRQDKIKTLVDRGVPLSVAELVVEEEK